MAATLREEFWEVMDDLERKDKKLFGRMYSVLKKIQDEFYRQLPPKPPVFDPKWIPK